MAYRSTYQDIASIADSLVALVSAFTTLNSKMDEISAKLTTLIGTIECLDEVNAIVNVNSDDYPWI